MLKWLETLPWFMAAPSITKLAYKTLQGSKNLAGLAHKGISTKLMEFLAPGGTPEVSPLQGELLHDLKKSMEELEKVDWQEAEQGIYPISQLFEAPWIEWARRYPLIWLDLPFTWDRRRKRNTRDIPNKINRQKYPDYYLQNFHHQTDGYFSDFSAGLYDLQVEILFNGTADSMRRRIISPLKKGLKNFQDRNQSTLRILDVATGTGRTLKQIRSSMSDVELIGIDLSAAYLRQASRYLNKRGSDIAQLIRGNAENLPFKSNSMQGVTCVYLLHELPKGSRQKVINECMRVLEPGGIFVLADSIQKEDSPKFETVLENFPKAFHEPYYNDYVSDNIEEKLSNSGFISIEANSHFMTRVWSAIKPIENKT